MKTFNKILAFGAVALGALAMSATVNAAAITCDDPADGRKVTLEYDDALATLSCGLSGTTGGKDGTPEGQFFEGLGYTPLEKIDFTGGNQSDSGTYITSITGLDGTSGSISLIDGLVDALLVFKFGAGGISPDYISFIVSGNLSADWSVGPAATATQALSHVTLYGDRPTDVPEPATLALLGLGLLGLGYRARRRQAV